VNYNLPPLTFEEQTDLLIKRGLNCERSKVVEILKSVSYYRLGEYFNYFKNADGNFRENNSFNKIWRSYTFDRQLRLIILDALERVEIALKTDVSYLHSHKYGPFGYLDRNNLPNLSPDWHRSFLEKIKTETQRSSESFVIDFFSEYGDEHEFLPVFKVTEIMSFGSLFTLYRGLKFSEKKQIARRYGIMAPVLDNWLKTLNYVRNICAHHGRLFNKELAIKPTIPHKEHNPEWHDPYRIQNYKVYSIIMVLNYLVEEIAPQSNWKGRFADLLAKYDDIPARVLGFPENWEEHKVWEKGQL